MAQPNDNAVDLDGLINWVAERVRIHAPPDGVWDDLKATLTELKQARARLAAIDGCGDEIVQALRRRAGVPDEIDRVSMALLNDDARKIADLIASLQQQLGRKNNG